MEQNGKTRKLLIEHYQRYPELQIQDIFKFIYQSAFGCEHLLASPEKAAEHIRMESVLADGEALTDALDGNYARVHLSYLSHGLSAETLAALFCASAEKEDGAAATENKLKAAAELVEEGLLPFSKADFDKAAEEWRAKGFPTLHHSEHFRAAYKPSYRVIASRYIPFLPLLARIDGLLSEGRAVLAIEGGSASGKSTLGKMLEGFYDCTVFRVDDFFLRPEQRNAERYAEVGGNVDRERLYEEVILPLIENKPVSYRKFDCSAMELCAPVTVTPKKLTVVEGVYSMHPYFGEYYDLSVFLSIAPELQKKRIEKRNSPLLAQRFFTKWIPLEEVYFSETQTKGRCDLIISIEE